MATTAPPMPRKNISIDSGQAPGILDLSNESILAVAVSIRDVKCMGSFAQVCTRFARLSNTPKFVTVLTEAFVKKGFSKIDRSLVPKVIANPVGAFFARSLGQKTRHSFDAGVRTVTVHEFARWLGSRMLPSHLNELSRLLYAWNEAERADDSVAGENHRGARMFAGLSRDSASDADPLRIAKNRYAIVLAALFSGQSEGMTPEVKNYANSIMSGLWRDAFDAISSLTAISDHAKSPSERMLAGHAALGIWLFLKQDTASASKEVLRSTAHDLFQRCSRCPAAAKIALLEEVVRWSAAVSITEKEPSAPKLRLSPGLDLSSPAARREWQYQSYFHSLNRLAENPETLNLDLAHRLFSVLYLAVTEMNHMQMPPTLGHLNFAKMLPKLPWRHNSQAGLHWLVRVLKHHAGKESWFNETPSDDRHVPLSLDQGKALLPDGIFTDKEMVYLLESTANQTFSWEELEKIDPLPSVHKGLSAPQ